MGVKHKKRGTSLIEIVVGMAILSILAVSAGVIIPTRFNKAYDARRKDDLHNIRINLEIYYGFAEQYPAELPSCGLPLSFNDQVIMDSVPCDPTTKIPYFYEIVGDGFESYRLYALLSDNTDISVVKVGCLGGCGPDCFYNYGVSSANITLERCSYVCAPGGGRLGSCERYEDPEMSLCPVLYYDDGVCNNECNVPANRCKNASGKNIPD